MKRSGLKVVTGGLGRVPKAPTWLNGHAAAEWARVAPELVRRGVLSPDLEGVLATYCAQVGTVRACEEVLGTEGLMFTGADGVPKPHPLLNAKGKAAATVLQLAKRLGLLAQAARAAEVPAPEARNGSPWA